MKQKKYYEYNKTIDNKNILARVNQLLDSKNLNFTRTQEIFSDITGIILIEHKK